MHRRALLALATLPIIAPARAQDLPAGPFRLVVGFSPGGGIDTLARLLARRFAEATGRPWVVENRSGAGGAIAAGTVARAAGDGTTLLLGEMGSIAIAPAIQANQGFDPLADLPPLTMIGVQPVVLVTNARGPADMAELVARARRGEIRNGTAGVGNPTHLFGVDLARRLGVPIEAVHYRAGGGAAAVALLSDEVQIAFAALGGALPQIRAGGYRALGTGDPAGLPALPGVPPVAAAAPGFEAAFWFGLHAPAATPAPLVASLGARLAGILAEAEFTAQLTAAGYQVRAEGPAAYAGFIRAEAIRLGQAAREAGLRPE